MEPWLTDYCGEPLTPREEAIARAAGQKLADRTQQLLNDWAYLDDAEFVQKYQIEVKSTHGCLSFQRNGILSPTKSRLARAEQCTRKQWQGQDKCIKVYANDRLRSSSDAHWESSETLLVVDYRYSARTCRLGFLSLAQNTAPSSLGIPLYSGVNDSHSYGLGLYRFGKGVG